MTLCACGCGQETKKKNKYIKYHHLKGRITWMKGKHHTEKSKKKNSDAHKNLSNETRKKLSDAQKGKIPWNKGLTKETDNRVRKNVEMNYGSKRSEESCKKISKSLKGHIPWNKGLTKETDIRLATASIKQKNRIFSDITRQKMSISAKNKPKINENTRLKMSTSRMGKKNHFYGKKHTKETRKKIKENHANISKEKHPNWMGGKSFEPYGLEFKSLRKEIRRRDSNTCQLCGEQHNKGTKLSVHHIDYNKQNSDINNLISLCVSCHTKTNYHRKKWTKYFTELKEIK